MPVLVETNEQNLIIHQVLAIDTTTHKFRSSWSPCSPVSHIYPFSCNPHRNKEPKCEWTCFSMEAKRSLLTFRNAWDAGASLEAELVAARTQEGSDEKASERVSPDYRMMRDGWKVRQRKQLGPPRPATDAAAALSLEHGAADNVGTSEPFMFRLKVPVRAGQAPTCRLLPSPPFNHIGIYILTLLHGLLWH